MKNILTLKLLYSETNLPVLDGNGIAITKANLISNGDYIAPYDDFCLCPDGTEPCVTTTSTTTELDCNDLDFSFNFECETNTYGRMFLYVTGGTFPYSYSLDNGLNYVSMLIDNVQFLGIGNGTRSYRIKDSRGCIVIKNYTVDCTGVTTTTEPSCAGYTILANKSVQYIDCNGQPQSRSYNALNCHFDAFSITAGVLGVDYIAGYAACGTEEVTTTTSTSTTITICTPNWSNVGSPYCVGNELRQLQEDTNNCEPDRVINLETSETCVGCDEIAGLTIIGDNTVSGTSSQYIVSYTGDNYTSISWSVVGAGTSIIGAANVEPVQIQFGTSGTATITVTTIDCNSETDTATFNVDMTAPVTTSTTTPVCFMPAPTGLTAVTNNTNLWRLNWTDNAVDEVLYQIEYSLNGSTWLLAVNTGANATSLTAEGVGSVSWQHNRLYYFRVRALGICDSEWSNTASVVTRPAVPILSLRIGTASVGSTFIEIKWDVDNNLLYTNITSVEIKRGGTVIATIPFNLQTLTDSVTGLVGTDPFIGSSFQSYRSNGLTSGVNYIFTVKFIGLNGSSLSSNSVSATTLNYTHWKIQECGTANVFTINYNNSYYINQRFTTLSNVSYTIIEGLFSPLTPYSGDALQITGFVGCP